jgi:hypothetical protein
MLFPNFYVPSVGVKFATDFERSRMSLSHLGGREQRFGANLSALHDGGPDSERTAPPAEGLFGPRQNENAIVVRRFLAEFSIDAD